MPLIFKYWQNGGSRGFIDFRKAFDLVDHNILLNKLALMNINKPFWLWIKNFLSGRVQQVNLMVLYHLLQRALLESRKAL